MKSISESSINNFGKYQGKADANRFLKSVLDQFVKNCIRYMENTHEAPYSYKEEQIRSFLAPAIHNKTTDAYMIELPVTRIYHRKHILNREEKYGRVDYWCRIGDQDYVLELKHCFVSYKTKKVTQATWEEWGVMCNQLDNVEKECGYFAGFAKGVTRIGLTLVTVYDNTRAEISGRWNKNGLAEMLENHNELGANWSSYWLADEQLIDSCKLDSGAGFYYYPGLLFMCKVYPRIAPR